MRHLNGLPRADVRNIYRDGVLLLSLFAPLIIILVVKYLVPLAAGFILDKTGFRLADYYPLVIGFMVLLTPMMFGIITGFLILEERDQEIITYLSVTPLSRAGYMAYRLSAPVAASFLVSFLFLGITGLTPFKPLPAMALALTVSLEAPIMALFLAAFANNKVEGLALSKAFGIMFLAPFAAYFIRSGWQYAAGIFPTFWITKSFLAMYWPEESFQLFIAIGLMSHILVIAALLKRFQRRAS
jgi:fluoroquinolone transport system permease protein